MKFKLFDFNKDGKGVELNEDTTPNIKYYFKSLWRKMARLLSINLLAILQFIPLFVAGFTYFWADTTPTVIDLNFPLFYGVAKLTPNSAFQVLLMMASPQLNIPVLTPGVILTILASLLIFAAIFGWCNVGFTYLMRELVTGRPVFILSDLKHAIKRNAKQGFLLGLIDTALILILGINIYSMGSMSGGFTWDFFYVANLAIAIIYIIMRFYIYLMAITFEIKIGKIFKNALIFVMLGIKRNLLAILWIAMLLISNVLLILSFPPLGLILPILYIVSVPLFTVTYAAYPVIKKYMIDPSPNAEDEAPEPPSDETVFSDANTVSAEQLWQCFCETEPLEGVEYGQFSFGVDADRLATLVLNGKKTATSSLQVLYGENEPLPGVGEYSVVLDSCQNAVCIIQAQKVYILPFNKVTEEHARLEGEGDGSLKQWKKAHKAFFSKELRATGLEFDENMKVVCEQFKVVYRPE